MKPLEELLEIAKSAKERADNAHEHICKLAKDGAKSWRLSIPVQDDDSDVLLQAPLDLVPQLSDAVIDLITQLKDAQVEIEKLKTGLGVAGEFIKRNEQLEKENAALKKRNGWLESGSIHTCHDECQRPLCVANRENKKSYDKGFGDGWENAIVPWKSRVQQLEQRLAECETALKKALEFGEYADWAIDADKNLQQLDIDARAYLSKWSVK